MPSRLSCRVFVALTASFFLLAGASAAADRNYDARVALIQDNGFAPGPDQAQAVAALQAARPGIAVSFDRATGATRTLSQRGGYLTRSNPAGSARDIALSYVNARRVALGLTTEDLANYEITDEVFSANTGATRLYLRQTHQGLPVYNGQLQVNVNRDGQVLSVANAFFPGLAEAVNTTEPALAGADAVDSAFVHLAGATGEPTDPELMVLPIRQGEARLVWRFQIVTDDGQHHYDFTVDAVSGQVWTRFDWTAELADEYTVYEAPIESPIHTSPLPPSDARTLQVSPENATASPLGWHDDGTNQYTITRGNNTYSYPDRDGNNSPDFDVDCNDGAGNAHCNFPVDLTMNPPAYIDAAVANLFYWNNYIHDTQYLYGFDEASGNFQEDNFGNGGVGGDSVNAEAQDNDLGGSNCNANFSTPADGGNGRMQMFTCNNASPERDGDFDNLVIVHEYAHGISNRLVGGPNNVSCLNNIQQPGEGWSDLYGLIYTHQAGFTGADARGVGSYLFDEPAVGGGIRTFPYSTDFGVNPDTYSTIASRSVPHGVGSVYAAIAWEAYWEIVNARGFDPDLQNVGANAGNHRAMLYFTEGMKNTACGPTFLDVRDGILQASIDNGVEDYCLLWRGFGRRGLGEDASTPGPNSQTGVDGFQIPAQCDENPSCGDGVCEFGEDCNSCGADCTTGGGGGGCGNGICETALGEDCVSCAADCNGKQNGKPANRFCCGAGGGENPVPCSDSRCTSGSFQCTDDPPGPGGTCCGDFVCEGSENDVNCAIDCPVLAGPACFPRGSFCDVDSDCCSNKCKGPRTNQTCN